MIPAAPLVGAVTTRPPAAFSSFTAIAYSVTQSIARSGSARARRRLGPSAPAARAHGAGPSARRAGCPRVAAVLDALLHDPQMSQQPAADLGLGAPGASFSSMSPLIDMPVSATVREQLVAACGRDRATGWRRTTIRSAPAAVLVDHETAADRVVGLLRRRVAGAS